MDKQNGIDDEGMDIVTIDPNTLLAFEEDHSVDERLKQALKQARDFGGSTIERKAIDAVATIYGQMKFDLDDPMNPSSGKHETFPIPAATIGVIAGAGGTGKSFLILRWIADAWRDDLGKERCFKVHSLPATDNKPACNGRIMYVSFEDDSDTIQNRLFDMGVGHVPEKLSIFAVADHTGLDMQIMDPDRRQRKTPLWNALRQEIVDGGYSMVFIDPLSRLIPSGTSENDNAGMTAMIDAIQELVNGTRCSIGLVAHATKGNQDSVRGASAITDGVRWAMTLTDPSQAMIDALPARDEGKKAAMTESRDEALQDKFKSLRLKVTKANRSKPITDYYLLAPRERDGAAMEKDTGGLHRHVISATKVAKPEENQNKQSTNTAKDNGGDW